MKLKSIALTFFTFCLATTAGTKAAEAASFSVVADGLNNPRGIGFDGTGNLYVTESGYGGDGKDGRSIPSPSAQYIPLSAGENGSILKITPGGKKENILSNLTSLALTPSGEQAAGPADIKFDSHNNAYFLTGYAGDPSKRDSVLKSPSLGRLYKLDLNTKAVTSLADFAQYELKNNPDGSDIITNPYALAIKGNTGYVVDGGGNAVYSVGLDGSGIKNVAKIPEKLISPDKLEFPQLPEGTVDPTGGAALPPGYTSAPNGLPVSNQSVPTGIAIAPDGNLTISEYTYFPYPEKEARLLSLDPDSLQAKVLADGFTQLTGVAYDPEGNLYALQHMNNAEWKEIQQGGIITGDISGSLIKIGKDGTRTTIWSGHGLEAASGITYGPDGDLYISNRARLAGTGQIIRIDPRDVPEPTSILGVLTAAALGASLKQKQKHKKLAKAEVV
ncbi:ScyD/ScyE family protein [Nostoc sp. 106C]|uniref:ScyD/ScyE family protein n=1 Tax=Nostoc sp. 106C TaxID=1932667 RepID=UPI000A3AB4DE|nr:ScyD/ScyE family protein [Nostoc sp. 106C]OUL21660.1 PEP-CTERM exosortase interaction domain-containing protein [Nostoc sp. RF31YmG]OUL24944.1 PEP-CTERM exosortase interaction domain-containing protein [Nostoc sp. 106C]